MPYEYIDDFAIADVAFVAREGSLEALVATSADALMNVMVENLDAIAPEEERVSRAEAEAEDLLLVAFLQEFVYHADAHGLLLRPAEVRIQREGGRLLAEAKARGEPADPQRHDLNAEVKAVTYYRLRVAQAPDGSWEAQVVLDI